MPLPPLPELQCDWLITSIIGQIFFKDENRPVKKTQNISDVISFTWRKTQDNLVLEKLVIYGWIYKTVSLFLFAGVNLKESRIEVNIYIYFLTLALQSLDRVCVSLFTIPLVQFFSCLLFLTFHMATKLNC